MAEIYIITNIKTGHRYIGKTKYTKEQRFYGHIKNSVRGHTTRLARAIRKYGAEAMIIETLEVCNFEDLNTRERYHIAQQKPEYNMTEGGDGGAITAPETRRLLSLLSKKRFETQPGTFKGRKHTLNAKLKNSLAHRGPHYEENLLKKHAPKDPLFNKGEKNPFYGKTHSVETRQMLAKIRTGAALSEDTKLKLSIASSKALSKTYKIINPNGHIIFVTGLKTFCRENNLPYTSLFATIKKNMPTNGWQVFRCESCQETDLPDTSHDNGQSHTSLDHS